jgi:rod shape determining protein RodA
MIAPARPGHAIIIVITVSAIMVVAGVPPRFMTLLAVVGSIGAVSASILTCCIGTKSTACSRSSIRTRRIRNSRIALRSQQRQERDWFGRASMVRDSSTGLQTVLGYVPEQRTDFIFTAIGEQLGFIGTSLVLLLLAFVAWRIFVIGRNAKDTMGRSSASASSSSSPSVASRTSA